MEHKKAIIIGSGPAGLTAAIYLARADLKPLVISGYEAGGQLMLTTEIDNFPGFPEGIQGPDLMANFRKQAERFGTDFVDLNVTEVDFSKRPFHLKTDVDEYTADTVIIATGASARWLGLESESKLRGRGVSSCATCDGAFFRNKDVVVIGGGDVAMEDGIFLTKFAKSVRIIHRRDALRASKAMQTRAMKNPKISFVWDTVIEDVLGEEKVTGVKVKNVKTGEITELECQGFFLAIGHTPNTEYFKGQVELDNKGYLVLKPGTHQTSVLGVFSAGDVHDFTYKQAITAAGAGCAAALETERYLESLED